MLHRETSVAGDYATHRNRLIAGRVGVTTLALAVTTLSYATAELIVAPGLFRASAWHYALQLATSFGTWAAVRWLAPQRHTGLVLLAGESVFTIALVAALWEPANSTGGVSLSLVLKLMATAVFFGWSPPLQVASGAFTLSAYAVGLVLSQRTGSGGLPLHELLGPVMAAALSAAGAALVDRTRLASFEQSARLARIDEEQRQQLLELRESQENSRRAQAELEALLRHQQEEAAISAALATFGEAVSRDLSAPDFLDRVAAITAAAVGCDGSHTVLWQPSEEAFVVVSNHGFDPEEQNLLRVLRIPDDVFRPFIDRVLDRGVVEDVVNETGGGRLGEFAWRYGIRSFLAVGLRRGLETIGVQVAFYRTVKPFTRRQFRILQGIGQMASLAIENGRLLRELDLANRLKSEFLAAMSHELRTPLNAMIGYGDLLREGAFGDVPIEQLEILERMDRASRELLDLIANTLDISRLDSGEVRIDVRDADPGALFREIKSDAEHIPRRAGVELHWDVPDGLPVVRTDPSKVKVIVKNLLTNACKFTDRGEVSLRVRGERGGWRIEVQDTGVGIPEDVQDVIFDAFRQAHDPAEPARGGLGLGLHIVQRLIEMLGGVIGLESEVGKGTTVSVRIPASAPSFTRTSA